MSIDVTLQGAVIVRNLVGRISTGRIRCPAARMSDTLKSYHTLLAYLTLRLDKTSLAHQALESVGWPSHHGHLFDSSVSWRTES